MIISIVQYLIKNFEMQIEYVCSKVVSGYSIKSVQMDGKWFDYIGNGKLSKRTE